VSYASSPFFLGLLTPSQRTPLPGEELQGSMTRANPPQAMVQPHGRTNSSPIHLPAPACFQQEDAKPASLSGYPIRILHGHLLALHPQVSRSAVNLQRARRALLPAHGFRHSRLVPG
jgi:hypothetical protein